MAAIDPLAIPWDPWRPEDVARLLDPAGFRWYVAAGWAIDLFLGGKPRSHEDLEITVPNSRFDEVAEALGRFEIFVITDRREATPLEQARDRLADTHQTWIRDPSTRCWCFDVFREPSDGETWICRRDPSITLPYAHVIERTENGIPYGRPEIVLLFKAKHAQEEKNERDFARTLPALEPARRAWLRGALERVHPAHPWLAALHRSAA